METLQVQLAPCTLTLSSLANSKTSQKLSQTHKFSCKYHRIDKWGQFQLKGKGRENKNAMKFVNDPTTAQELKGLMMPKSNLIIIFNKRCAFAFTKPDSHIGRGNSTTTSSILRAKRLWKTFGIAFMRHIENLFLDNKISKSFTKP